MASFEEAASGNRSKEGFSSYADHCLATHCLTFALLLAIALLLTFMHVCHHQIHIHWHRIREF